MTPAAEKLRERIAGIDISMPNVPVIHNCNVTVASNSDEIRDNLVTQLDSPVLWVPSVEKLVNDESGPGKVLCGMIKRIVKGVNATNVDTPDSIESVVNG